MLAIVALTENGKKLARKLSVNLPGKNKIYLRSAGTLKVIVEEIFDRDKFEGIIFIMALGIVVRLIAKHLKDKYQDPAVVVVDEANRFSISVASGHQGGANKLAIAVSNILSNEPVITTSSETSKKYIVGIGCQRGIKKQEIITAISYATAYIRCPINKIRYIVTIDLKKNESGLKSACLELEIPLKIVSSDMIKNFQGRYQRSSFVKEKIGVEGVSEPCALLAARRPKLILPKKKVGRVTVAIAKEA